MKLTRKSWWVKWAYMDKFILRDGDHPIPAQTTICDLVGRSIFIPPAFGVFLLLVGCVFVIASPFFLIEWAAKKYFAPTPPQKSVIVQRFEDWRERKCTKVEIAP